MCGAPGCGAYLKLVSPNGRRRHWFALVPTLGATSPPTSMHGAPSIYDPPPLPSGPGMLFPAARAALDGPTRNLMCRHLVDELVQPRTCSVAPTPNSSFREWSHKACIQSFRSRDAERRAPFDLYRAALAFSKRHSGIMRWRSKGPLKGQEEALDCSGLSESLFRFCFCRLIVSRDFRLNRLRFLR